MKLAIVTLMDLLPWGGSEELWAAAAMAARERRMDVDVFIYDWSEVPARIARLEARGACILRRPRRPSFRQRLVRRLFNNPVRLVQQIQSSRPDLVLISQGGTYELIRESDLLRFLNESHIPYVIVCQHNCETPIPVDGRQAARPAFDNAALIAFVSHRNLLAARRQLAADLPKAIVLQNPINLKKYDVIPWPSGHAASFASVARYTVGAKGQDLLFEALSSSEWRQRDWELSLFGEGNDRAYLFDLAKLYGIADRVRFRGHCPDVAQIWTEHQLLVLPSRSEGTSLALMESLIAGRPALVTDVGDSGRWVQEGQTGFIAEAATSTSIACALNRAWASRQNWREMGQLAHKKTVSVIDRDPGSTLLMHSLTAANLA